MNRIGFLLRFGLIALTIGVPAVAEASGGDHAETFSTAFLFLAVMWLLARIGIRVKHFGQPPVLGELLMGLALKTALIVFGITAVDALLKDSFVSGMAEGGAILLLFIAGLETSVPEMLKVGPRALAVAIVGVLLPLVGGYLASMALVPDSWLLAGHPHLTHIFVGATLTATSVGITARVFKDLNFGKSPEARTVLGAAVIDDVLGLVILATVKAIIESVLHGGTEMTGPAIGILVAHQFGGALVFLVVSVVAGLLIAPRAAALLARIHPGAEMKAAMAFLFCATFAYAAVHLAGLAGIVGAFAAGLVLTSAHFTAFEGPTIVQPIRRWIDRIRAVAATPALAGSDAEPSRATLTETVAEMEQMTHREEEGHVEGLMQGIASLLTPIFFIYTMLLIDVRAFLDLSVLFVGLALTIVAVAGKFAAGFVAGSADATTVGIGMSPRGEVGLVFVNIGIALGVVTPKLSAAVLIVVVLTTFVTPPLLKWRISQLATPASASAAPPASSPPAVPSP